MELTKMSDTDHKGVKSQKPGTAGATVFDETHISASHSVRQQEVIKDSKPITLHAVPSSSDGKICSKEKAGSPELTQRLSRTETVRQDARKLKMATLNRMGKMFKLRSQTPVGNKSFLNIDGGVNPIKSVEDCTQEPPRKDKSNSLGRMLKLVDKDGSPKKLFHPRAGSLSRILRRHPNNDDNEDKKPAEDNAPGIFSRMLNQLKGK
ncbi:uncharacterized protein LOC143378525 [Andrena cerasifolii]|uniref:uncharacterized protein LOC143378525 n=1 Tax=Andrena cerasifolii TaxID=2819439 RepID=UPI0040382EA1